MLLIKITNSGTGPVNNLVAGGTAYLAVNHALRLDVNAAGRITSIDSSVASNDFTASATLRIQLGQLTTNGGFSAYLDSE